MSNIRFVISEARRRLVDRGALIEKLVAGKANRHWVDHFASAEKSEAATELIRW
ncbi:MAG: hypothetical protein GTO41_26270 [Burkholderiales bacterium]|nr:hypothetical protein [Burkholderiales bacterium]